MPAREGAGALGDGAKFGERIQYVFQDALLGTANVLAAVPRPSGPFIVLGGDNVVDAALVKSLLNAPGEGPALAIHKSDAPSRYGVVTLDASRVTRTSWAANSTTGSRSMPRSSSRRSRTSTPKATRRTK